MVYSHTNMERDGHPEYLTTKDAADTLGYTVQHTRLLIRQGKLEATKLGRDWLVVRESVAEYRVGQGTEGEAQPDDSTQAWSATPATEE